MTAPANRDAEGGARPLAVNRDVVDQVVSYLVAALSRGPDTLVADPLEEPRHDYPVADADYAQLVDDLSWISSLWGWSDDHDDNARPCGYVLSRLVSGPAAAATEEGRKRLADALSAAIAADPRVTPVPAPPALADCLSFRKKVAPKAPPHAAGQTGPGAPSADGVLATPQSIYDYLSSRIYGQEAAKKAAAMIVWNHIHGRARNAVFIGPTGSGKTAIWDALRRVYPHIVVSDASRLSQEGWNGNVKVTDMFRGMPPDEAGRTIYVMDESDKMFEPKTSSGGENVSLSIQSEFLKIIEGAPVRIDESTVIDTSGCSFVFLGSFGEMVKAKAAAGPLGIGFGSRAVGQEGPTYEQEFTPDDLVEYAGIRREIAGRIATIVQLSPMGADEYLAILRTPSMSPLDELAALYHRPVVLSDEAARKLCEKAAESGMGVRYLRARILEEIDRLEFDDPGRSEFRLFEGGA